MRPNASTFLALLTFLPAPAALAGAPTDEAAAAEAAAVEAQALPPAPLPDPALVSVGARPGAPERAALEEEIVLGDAPDEPEIVQKIEQDSADLEAVRQAEERTHVDETATVQPHAADGDRVALLPEIDHGLAKLQAEYDIPIEVNPAVAAYVRFFQSPPTRGHFVKWLGRSHRYIDHYRVILREAGLPEDTVYLAMIESGFGNFAYSRARASGPWQFISSTGRLFGLKQDFWVDERRDPEKSARAAARYLKLLHDQTGDWRLAWAGYNAGVGKIFRAKAKGQEDFWEMAAGRVLRKETKGYVPKLMAAAIIAKHPGAFGFRAEEIDRDAWPEYEEVPIPNATLLAVIARAAGVTERDIVDLNPELRRACTPPRSYVLKIPKASVQEFARNWPAARDRVRLTFAGHVVRRGDTLSGIASRYGVPVQGIVEMNGVRSVRRLRPGTELLIPKPVSGGTLARAEPPRSPERRAPAAQAPATTVAETAAAPAPVAAAAPAPEVVLAPSHAVAIAAPAAAAAPAGARTTLRVQQGDTLWSISQRFGVGLRDLARWNGIRNPRRHTLQIGRTLVVYAAERG
jgi:membrane-bound lytic murein transglycosylase D